MKFQHVFCFSLINTQNSFRILSSEESGVRRPLRVVVFWVSQPFKILSPRVSNFWARNTLRDKPVSDCAPHICKVELINEFGEPVVCENSTDAIFKIIFDFQWKKSTTNSERQTKIWKWPFF